MIDYAVFLTSGELFSSFQSEWQFIEGESLFFQEEGRKRNFVITRVTHDIAAATHQVRLYCVEKRTY